MKGIRRLVHLRRTVSTQTYARRLADRGAEAWTVVRADRQTRGRGRMERRWSSGAGGLFFSVILRPRMKPSRLPRMSLQAGRACAAALRSATGLDIRIKPPNDILARRARDEPFRKVCGILIEASGTSREIHWVVVGIGVNVSNRIPRLLPHAASLASLTGRRPCPEAILRKLVRELRRIWKDA
ncbi:biotin--[acetyl-CoA-carboxylase] ligase [Elusimicrobiota bacterium]